MNKRKIKEPAIYQGWTLNKSKEMGWYAMKVLIINAPTLDVLQAQIDDYNNVHK